MGWAARLLRLARLSEVIFIPLSYGIFYLTAKSLLRHCKKIVLITWLLSGKFYIFNIDSRRLQQFHFTVYSIMNMITAFSILLQLHEILLILVLLIFCLSGSTGCSHFEIEFGKNSKTHACVLKKNLSHLAGMTHLHMFI